MSFGFVDLRKGTGGVEFSIFGVIEEVIGGLGAEAAGLQIVIAFHFVC